MALLLLNLFRHGVLHAALEQTTVQTYSKKHLKAVWSPLTSPQNE